MADKRDKRKRQSAADVQKDLRELTQRDSAAPQQPPIDLKKIYLRAGAVIAVLWIVAVIVRTWSTIPMYLAGLVTVAAIGAGIWARRFVHRTQALGAILRDADSEEGRREALKKIDTEFKGDTQALIAKAQIQLQEDPRQALATLESINLDKQLAPIAGQVRAMRAMIHLTFGEIAVARQLVDKLDLGKQQEPKTRAMFATVAAEAWARSGTGQKAVETLNLFNPDDPEYGELKIQMWRARAFAAASVNDAKGAARALKKLGELNPHLLGQFIGQKRVHPLLEKEAKQIVMRMGAVPRKVVRQRM